MYKLINCLLLSSIFYCFIISVLSKDVIIYEDQNKIFLKVPYDIYIKKIDLQAEYNIAVDDYEIFQSLECNGTFNYKIFAKVDKICKDCQNLLKDHPIKSQCR